jgi:hypothetical protein
MLLKFVGVLTRCWQWPPSRCHQRQVLLFQQITHEGATCQSGPPSGRDEQQLSHEVGHNLLIQ